MRLAAYVSSEGIISGLKEKGSVIMYEQADDGWQEIGVFPMDVNTAEDLEQLQTIIKSVAAQLKECSVLIARDMTGVMNAILDSVGIKTWRAEGNIYDELPFIAGEEERELLESMMVGPEPISQGSECSGKFGINLVETMKAFPKLNSREILIPFLMRGSFRSLEIICEHPPKWLETDADKLNVSVQSKALSTKGIKMIVVPKDAIGTDHCSSCAPSVPLSSCSGGSRRKGGCCG